MQAVLTRHTYVHTHPAAMLRLCECRVFGCVYVMCLCVCVCVWWMHARAHKRALTSLMQRTCINVRNTYKKCSILHSPERTYSHAHSRASCRLPRAPALCCRCCCCRCCSLVNRFVTVGSLTVFGVVRKERAHALRVSAPIPAGGCWLVGHSMLLAQHNARPARARLAHTQRT